MSVHLWQCLTIIEQIVETAEQRRTGSVGEGMRNIYITSNGDWQWLADLKVALRRVYY